jgi:hypothetical protein
MAGADQVGAAFAVYFKTKNQTLRQVIKGALPVGMLGIGEPLIFGVTLPLGRPFLTACLGGAMGGAFQAEFRIFHRHRRLRSSARPPDPTRPHPTLFLRRADRIRRRVYLLLAVRKKWPPISARRQQ